MTRYGRWATDRFIFTNALISQVVATVRSLAKFPDELKAAGTVAVSVDLSDSDHVIKSAAEEAIRAYGHVDVLVNNSGVFSCGVGPVEEMRCATHVVEYVLRGLNYV